MTLSICTAQLNFVVGDMPANARKIIAAAHEAHARGARLLLTPELALCGYAAEDLFEKLPLHWMWWPALGGLAIAWRLRRLNGARL